MAPSTIAVFRVCPDGSVEIPPGGAELIFVSMVYLPNSWSEISDKLATLPCFALQMTPYNLAYAFTAAIVRRHRVLLDLVHIDPSDCLALPSIMEPIYGHRQSPLQFWDSPDGILMKETTKILMSALGGEQSSFTGEVASRNKRMEFVHAVDRHCMNTRSLVNWVMTDHMNPPISMLDLLVENFRLSWARFTVRPGAGGVGHVIPYPQPGLANVVNVFMHMDALLGLRRTYRTSEEELGYIGVRFSDSRAIHLRNTIEGWVMRYAEAVDEQCAICHETFPPPVVSRRPKELPVRTPCNHVLGKKCLKTWLDENSTCPICRAVIISDTYHEYGYDRLFPSSRGILNYFMSGITENRRLDRHATSGTVINLTS